MNTTAGILLSLTGAKSVRAMAAQAGLEPSTLNRQANGTSSLTVETVVALCRTYSIDIASAFVAVGFINQHEADALGRAHSLSEYSDLELAQEIVDRLKAGSATPALTEPMSFEPGTANVSGMTHDELSNIDLSQGNYALAATHDNSSVEEQSHPDDEDQSQDTEDN